MESVIKLAIQVGITCMLIRYLVLIRTRSTLVKSDSLSALISLHAGYRITGTRSEHFRLHTTLLGVVLTSHFWIIRTSIMYLQHMQNVSKNLVRQKSNT